MPRRVAKAAPPEHYDRDGILALEGDMREVLAGMEAESFTACVTDPPYHLTSQRSAQRSCIPGRYDGKKAAAHGFMGKTWDGGGIAFDPDTWRAVLRVLKPGGILLAFGGTRTYHRIACAVEDAGFELRDCLMWMYGSGFPKSYNIAKGIQAQRAVDGEITLGDPAVVPWVGYGSALKPAWEPIILAMKPLEGGYARNALKHGVAGLNVDGGRIVSATPIQQAAGAPGFGSDRDDGYAKGTGRRYREGEASADQRYTNRGVTDIAATPGPRGGAASGRWPANVLLSHDPRCVQVGTAPDPGRVINRFKDGAKPFGGGAGHEYESERVPGGEREVWACVPGCPVRTLDEQSGDRHGMPRTTKRRGISPKGYGIGVLPDPASLSSPGGFGDTGGASRFFYTAKASTAERSAGLSPAERNAHPTVKPVDLMRYLITLVTMPSGTKILDPFMGSGSTLVAAKQLGVECVGIDSDAESCETAAARLSRRTDKGVGKRRRIKCRGRSRRKP